MTEALVIVESPAKAKTINKFLGKGYRVEPSMGHVRDLPRKELGVDVEADFRPSYEVIGDRKKVIDRLAKQARKAARIIVATDPDREGEAIGWHLAEVLRHEGDVEKPVLRVMFNEITKRAVAQAMEQPTEIDQRRVDAQQTRRILDRLMGYRLSPLLWDKVRRGLSAGRVQSVALRIVCDREREIDVFVPREYWVVTAHLEGARPPIFKAKLKRRAGQDFEVGSADEMAAVREALDGASWKVASLETKERRRNAAPPYTTSKFQQEASRRHRMPVRRCMQLAQALYEGKEIPGRGSVGLITYMRTDSTRVADSAIEAVRAHVAETHGEEYLPPKPVRHRSKKGAQDAHEAIRPTFMDLPPAAVAGTLSREELNIYTLIWNRFVASQMKPALHDETIVQVEAGELGFEARGSVLKFPGFLAAYQEAESEDEASEAEQEGRFPQLAVGEPLALHEMEEEQKFTQPPPRFTEATLVKELEENGIGRPSTYAQILQTLRQREYCEVRETRFHPTELGRLVNDLLVESFDDLMDLGYTAKLEQELDDIEEGRRDWLETLRDFNAKFVADLERAKTEMRNVKAEAIETDEVCDKCGKKMLLRWGRFGRFLACSGYPECRNTREQEDEDQPEFDMPCPHCGQKMSLRKGRFGPFLACPEYPTCKGTARIRRQADGTFRVLQDRLLDEKCPECEERLIEREGRYGPFVSCTGYPKCTWIKQEKTGVLCPQEGCAGELVVKRSRRSKGFYGCNQYPKCDFVVWDKPLAKPCPKCGAPFTCEKETKKYGTFNRCWRDECDWHDGPEDMPKPRPRKRRPAAASSQAAPKGRAGRKAAARKATTSRKKKASSRRTTAADET